MIQKVRNAIGIFAVMTHKGVINIPIEYSETQRGLADYMNQYMLVIIRDE